MRRRSQLRTIVAATLVSWWLVAGCGSPQAALSPDEAADAPPAAGAGECDWPMWGHDTDRTFSYPCPTAIAADTVGELAQRWFFNTYDVVTATPAVVDGTVYVGDWSGRFYAVDAETGTERWQTQLETHVNVYAGQIVSSAAVADVDGRSTIFAASGRTMNALDPTDGSVRWTFRVGTGAPDDHTEIESSPVVADGLVLFGTDVHNHEGQVAGFYALDAATGEQRWFFDPDEGRPPSGCVDVWGSAAVDLERRAVFFGTGSCDTPNLLWGPNTEAVLAVDLDTGAKRWSYQPHEASRDDLDYAGAPNLFTTDRGRALVGLGNKDATYYALDRDTGELVWSADVTEGGATGGFIGPAAFAQGIIAGGTAVGDAPFLHGIDANDGRVAWQQPRAQATYAATSEANGVVFSGGNDFTLRAVDLFTGELLWSTEVAGVVAGGSVVVGDDLYAVAGIREPGLDKRSETSGIYRFSLGGGPAGSSTTTTTAPRADDVPLSNADQPCIGAPCPMNFRLKPVPEGLDPSATLEVTADPFSVTFEAADLGRPDQWLTPGTAAADEGATTFALFASESDDNPVGGLLCELDDELRCTADSLPRLTTYNRISLLAVTSTDELPSPADGLARLITTVSFEPPLTPVGADGAGGGG